MSETSVPSRSGFRALRSAALRRSWLVAIAIATALGAAWGFSSVQPVRYEGTAVLIFQRSLLDLQLTGVSLTGSGDSAIDAVTDVELVSRANVRIDAAARLGPGFSAESLKRQLEIAREKRSRLVDITATAGSPQQAARVANTVAASFLRLANDRDAARIKTAADRVRTTFASSGRSRAQRARLTALLVRLNVLAALGPQSVEILQSATPPTKRSSPRTTLNLVVGGILGVVVGLALAFGLEHFDRRLRYPEELEAVTGVDLLTIIYSSKRLRRPLDPAWRRDIEPFRRLRGALRARGVSSVMLVSPGSGSGTSTVALYLAMTAAENEGERAVLVEANLRRPVLANALGPYLGASHPATAALRPVVLPDGDGALFAHLAGASSANPVAVLESDHFRNVLRDGRDGPGLTVIDAPSPLHVSDAFALVHEVDGVVIIGRSGKDTPADLARLAHELRGLGAHVVGAVFNGERRPRRRQSRARYL